MNHIEKARNDIKAYFSEANASIGNAEIIFSPSKNFRVETQVYNQTDPQRNWEVTKVEVFNNHTAQLLFSFFVNEGTFFHSWVTKNNTEYLLCAEDLCGGQTIIDLTNVKMSSFTGDDDGFIWTHHLLSPNEKLLAVFGCGWGSQFFVIVYHFDNPMELPLKIANEPDWTGYDIIDWIDNENLKVKKTKDDESVLKI